MTREAHLPGACPPSAETIARVRATVYGPQVAELARIANYAALDNPAQGFSVADSPTGTYSFSYTPAATPARRYLRVMMQFGTTSGSATLTIRDNLGNSVTGAVATIPLGFRGEAYALSGTAVGTRFDYNPVVRGDFDLAALAATLTGAEWSWDFVVSVGGGLWSCFAYELPRFLIDTAETYGALPGAFLGGAEIDDDSAAGTERILTTLVGARTTERVYLSLAWPQDTAAVIPQTTSTSYAALTNLDEGGSVETWRVYVRRLAASSAQGEPVVYRVLYRLSGGAGTETASVRLETGSSASPFALAGLAHTGTSWVWSAWKAGYLATNETAAGYEQTDTLGMKGQISAGGPTLYLAGIHVLGAAT